MFKLFIQYRLITSILLVLSYKIVIIHSVDCIYGEWGPWTNCTNPCGGGRRQRVKPLDTGASLLTFDINGDRENTNPLVVCSAAVDELGHCNSFVCNSEDDCVLSEWSAWTKCLCDNEERERTRDVIKKPKAAGKVCDSLIQKSLCEGWQRPNDCKKFTISTKHPNKSMESAVADASSNNQTDTTTEDWKLNKIVPRADQQSWQENNSRVHLSSAFMIVVSSLLLFVL